MLIPFEVKLKGVFLYGEILCSTVFHVSDSTTQFGTEILFPVWSDYFQGDKVWL